ncbi:MAG: hypothetical protein QHJ82_15465 [Verrucomicrobiota bacterium]|nr:hypothetical protein [Verrucomicrobiota bacterium]
MNCAVETTSFGNDMQRLLRLFGLCFAVIGLDILAPTFLHAAGTDDLVVYATGFEVAEGYSHADEGLPLWEEDGWLAEGSGGCGLVEDFFPGYGQQAYLGYSPPAYKDEFLTVWRPFDVVPPLPGRPVVMFEVLMQVVDSTNHEYDDFRWSAYNTDGQRLFTLDFDNSRAEIFYALDDNAGFTFSGFGFSNDALYQLQIMMNFERNNWMALLNGQVVVDSQPITTTGARLDLSDMDAVWAIRRKGAAGDNYLLFDEYRVTSLSLPTIPPVLEIVGIDSQGQFELLLHGERGLKYAIDVTEDFGTWDSLATNTVADGTWRFLDTTSPSYPMSFYRARQVSD